MSEDGPELSNTFVFCITNKLILRHSSNKAKNVLKACAEILIQTFMCQMNHEHNHSLINAYKLKRKTVTQTSLV